MDIERKGLLTSEIQGFYKSGSEREEQEEGSNIAGEHGGCPAAVASRAPLCCRPSTGALISSAPQA